MFTRDLTQRQENSGRCGRRDSEHEHGFPSSTGQSEGVQPGEREDHAGRMAANVDLVAPDGVGEPCEELAGVLAHGWDVV